MKKIWTLLLIVLFPLLIARAYEPLPSQKLCNEKTTLVKMQSRHNWSEYANWSNQLIRATLDDAPSEAAIFNRLLTAQDAHGDWFKSFYGDDARNSIQNLLRTHSEHAHQVFAALGRDDKEAYQHAVTAWYENADQLATALHSLNPNWEADTMRKMLNTLLELLEKQASAHHAQNWDKEINLSDECAAHLQDFADQLAAGVINQFAEGFK